MNNAIRIPHHRAELAEDTLATVNYVAFIGLAAYLVLAIMRFQEYTWISLNIPIIPLVESVMILAWAMSAKPPGLSNHAPVILLGVVYFISSLAAGAEYSVEGTQNYFLNIAFVYVVLAQVAADPKRADIIMAVFCTCMGVISLQCILMSIHPNHMGWTGLQAWVRLDAIPVVWQVRYIGTLGDPNDLGMTLLAAVPMMGYLAITTRSRLMQLYFLVALGMTVYTIYLLNSRGTVLGLVAVIAVFGVIRFGVARASIVGVIAVPVALAFAPSRMADSGMDQSALDRIDSWYNGMKMFTSNPFFGVGKDQYLQYHHKVSHNSWIEQVAEFGMIGYLLWNRIVLGALLDVYQMVAGDYRLKQAVAGEQAENEIVIQRSKREARLQGIRPSQMPAPKTSEVAQTLLAKIPDSEVKRSQALLMSIVGLLVSIFFIDRSDSLITFLVCALIAGSLTRYEHQRNDINWLPVAFWVYLGAFCALVVVYTAIQVFVLG